MATYFTRTLPHVWRISAGARLFVVRVHPLRRQPEDPAGEIPQGAGGLPAFHEHPHGIGHHAVCVQRHHGHRARQGGRRFLYLRLADRGGRGGDGRARQKLQKGLYRQRFQCRVRTHTLADILALKEQTGHSTVAVTDDGTANGKLLGIVASRDYRVSPHESGSARERVYDAV